MARAVWPLVFLIPLLQIAAILWLIWERSTDVVMSDEWSMLPLVQHYDQGTLRVGEFWQLHGNAHRLVIPRVITLLLIELTSWHRQVIMTFNLLIVIVSAVLILRSVRSTFRSTSAMVLSVVPLSIFLFSFTRYHNWLKPFTDKIPTAFGVALCLWALSTRPVGRRHLGIAIGGALIASLSSLGGLAAWIAFAPAVWRLGHRRFGIWIAVAVTTIGAYSLGFPFGADAPTTDSALLRIPAYVVGYLGAPIGVRNLERAQVAGVLSVVLLVFNLLVYFLLGRAAKQPDEPIMTWIGLALFAIGCAGLTGIGREDNNEGLASRYNAFSVLWWVASLVITAATTARLVRAIREQAGGRARPIWWGAAWLNSTAVASILVGMVAANATGFKIATGWQEDQRQHQQCILAYKSATKECLSLFGNPAVVRPGATYLSQQHLAIFRNTTENTTGVSVSPSPGPSASASPATTEEKRDRPRKHEKKR